MNKTLEEIRKEFEEKKCYCQCHRHGRGIRTMEYGERWHCIDCSWRINEKKWKLLESTISQTKQKLIEEKRKTEYEILNVFVQFMYNGHNLNRHDLDRIESEWALFEARNYPDLFLEKLSNNEHKKN